MAYLGKQQVSSGIVPKTGQKKSLFQPPKFPVLAQNVAAPPPTKEGAKDRQPQPGAPIAKVKRSIGQDQSITTLPTEEGVQLQETKQTEKGAQGDNTFATAPRTDGKHIQIAKRADGIYKKPATQLIAPPRPRSPMEGVIQAKLTIGRPNDRYEQEAERVAQQVVSRLQSHDRRPTNRGDENQTKNLQEEEVQLSRKPMEQSIAEGGVSAPAEIEAAIERERGRGQPLEPSLQSQMELAMGADFSGVRLHTDAESERLNKALQAKAFTTGKEVYMLKGEYQPRSERGQELLAHELTHVVQQGGAEEGQGKMQRKGGGVIMRQMAVLKEQLDQMGYEWDYNVMKECCEKSQLLVELEFLNAAEACSQFGTKATAEMIYNTYIKDINISAQTKSVLSNKFANGKLKDEVANIKEIFLQAEREVVRKIKGGGSDVLTDYAKKIKMKKKQQQFEFTRLGGGRRGAAV